jgi:hypothetical protein
MLPFKTGHTPHGVRTPIKKFLAWLGQHRIARAVEIDRR